MGDVVVTSGIDGVYPPGFVVGRVETIDRAGGTFRTVRVRPAVSFSDLEEVLVVLQAEGATPAEAAATAAKAPARESGVSRIEPAAEPTDPSKPAGERRE